MDHFLCTYMIKHRGLNWVPVRGGTIWNFCSISISIFFRFFFSISILISIVSLPKNQDQDQYQYQYLSGFQYQYQYQYLSKTIINIKINIPIYWYWYWKINIFKHNTSQHNCGYIPSINAAPPLLLFSSLVQCDEVAWMYIMLHAWHSYFEK